MELKEFPKWKYHENGNSKIVNDAVEEDELNAAGGWSDSPQAASGEGQAKANDSPSTVNPNPPDPANGAEQEKTTE